MLAKEMSARAPEACARATADAMSQVLDQAVLYRYR